MRSRAVLFGLITSSAIAHAQSRADQEPQSRPDVQLPVAPAPSDEINDAPPRSYPQPDIVSPPPEPATKLVLPGAPTDTLSNHLLLSLRAGYVANFVNLDSATSLSARLAGGYGASIGVGYGLSRYVEVELEGGLAAFGAASDCAQCSGKSYDMIGAIRYHLVQGVRFDPWVRIGIGASLFRLEQGTSKRDYAGLQWLNASVGGDWYVTRNFGFGPMLTIGTTSYLSHPSDSSLSVAIKGLAGINLTFDTAGK